MLPVNRAIAFANRSSTERRRSTSRRRARSAEMLRSRTGSKTGSSSRGMRANAVRGESAQLVANPRNHGLPVTRLWLAKQTHRWIPRRILAINHPSPVARHGEQGPHRHPERARQMGGKAVDGDHEIECAHDGGGFLDRIAAADPAGIARPFRKRLPALQGMQLDARDSKQGLEKPEWNRA